MLWHVLGANEVKWISLNAVIGTHVQWDKSREHADTRLRVLLQPPSLRPAYTRQQANSELTCISVSKQVLVQNFSYKITLIGMRASL